MLLCVSCAAWWRGQGSPGKMEPTGSDICCLTSDKDGLHGWRTGRASRARRSRGARLEVGRGHSPSTTFLHSRLQEANQLQTPADHLGRGGGNCKSNGPLILVGVQPLSFHAKQEATSLSALPFSSQFVFSSLSGCIHPTLVMKDISYRVWRKPRRSSAPRMEQTGQYDTQSHYVCVCVCACMILLSASWQTQRQLPSEYSGRLCGNSLSPKPLQLSHISTAAFSIRSPFCTWWWRCSGAARRWKAASSRRSRCIINDISMHIVSRFHILSGAVCVCQLVFRMTCSHLKPAASRVVYYMAIWVSLLKDSLKAGFLKLLLCGRGKESQPLSCVALLNCERRRRSCPS